MDKWHGPGPAWDTLPNGPKFYFIALYKSNLKQGNTESGRKKWNRCHLDSTSFIEKIIEQIVLGSSREGTWATREVCDCSVREVFVCTRLLLPQRCMNCKTAWPLPITGFCLYRTMHPIRFTENDRVTCQQLSFLSIESSFQVHKPLLLSIEFWILCLRTNIYIL